MSDKLILEIKLHELLDKTIPDNAQLNVEQLIKLIGFLMSQACAIGYNYAKSQAIAAMDEEPLTLEESKE